MRTDRLTTDGPRAFSLFIGGLVVLALLAFWTPYFSRITLVSEPYVHLHVVLVVLWMAMLIGQPLLIRARRLALHRSIGRASFGLAPAIAVSALLLAHSRFSRMDAPAFDRAAYSLWLPVMATVAFLGSYGLAITYRRRMAAHAVFMLGTGLSLVDPILVRLIFFYTPAGETHWIYDVVAIAVITGVLTPVMLRGDRSGHARPATAVLLGLFALLTLGWLTLARTDAWAAFARWFVALPLT
ncbi:MAG: hypothetical protein AB7U83_01400 [Vicinamibacterales bacterium]